jgi:hypothetical protein
LQSQGGGDSGYRRESRITVDSGRFDYDVKIGDGEKADYLIGYEVNEYGSDATSTYGLHYVIAPWGTRIGTISILESIPEVFVFPVNRFTFQGRKACSNCRCLFSRIALRCLPCSYGDDTSPCQGYCSYVEYDMCAMAESATCRLVWVLSSFCNLCTVQCCDREFIAYI